MKGNLYSAFGMEGEGEKKGWEVGGRWEEGRGGRGAIAFEFVVLVVDDL